uniref:Zinc finger protein 385B n=2 Tax=Erpetoichthys calabaricus TaxID=27687 RepID=A0A8C4S4X9_ERPCA
MKRPLTPEHHLLENLKTGTQLVNHAEEKEPSNGPTDLQRIQEKKKLLYSLCEACNIQLYSAAQAQVHYNGKSHLKRVKQLNNGKIPPSAPAAFSTGSACQGGTLSSLARAPALMMQPSLDVKPFISFPVDTSSAAGLFPNFNTMDPVQKAVINHTFGVSIPPKKKQVISCNICQLRFNSDSQAEAHYKGSKHAKKLKSQDSGKTKQKSSSAKNGSKAGSAGTSGPSAGPPNKTDKSEKRAASSNMARPTTRSAGLLPISVPKPATLETTPRETAPVTLPVKNGEGPMPTESEEEKARKLLYCSLCKVAVNSLSQLEAHNTGSKHKTMLEARNGAGPIKAYPRPGSKLKVQTSVVKGSGLQNKTFHCEICDVHVNSEIQLKQHISSRRHKDRVAGKPMKPKYSPYNKQQRSPSILAAKLAFQKDIVKPLAPSFLSHPFSAAAMSPLPLQARPNASLFQTPALPPSLLRAAPGPLRPPAGSILFAPY